MKKESVYIYTGAETLNVLSVLDNTNVWLVPNKEYLFSDEAICSNTILGILVQKGYLVPRGTHD